MSSTHAYDAEPRTEPPTPLRLQEARRQGIVARSADVSASAVTLAMLAALAWLGPMVLAGVQTMTTSLLDGRARPLASPSDLASLTCTAVGGVLLPLAGLLGLCVVAAAVAGLVQVGMRATVEPIRPKWSRLSISGGLRRMVSGRSGVRMLLAGAKIALAGWLIVSAARSELAAFWAVGEGPTQELLPRALEAIRPVVWRLAIVLAAMAGADWVYQRWQYRRNLRMTRREWKDDLKRMEGDPEIRRRRRNKARRDRQRPARSEQGGGV